MRPKHWSAYSLPLLVAVILLFVQQLCKVATSQTRTLTAPDFVWKQSLPIRSGDPQIKPIGGTEVRNLVVFDNKLFAAIGYWMDTETENPALPGAQVLRLDSPGSQWQVDLELNERTPQGLRKYYNISTLNKVRFTIDSTGRQLTDSIDLLLASVWKRGFGLDLFSRVAGSSSTAWSKTTIPGDQFSPPYATVRAFLLHTDRITGDEIVFAGATNAIFAGRYDSEHQSISWNPQPETRWHDDLNLNHSDRARVSSLAECNGRLFATTRGAIYERADGTVPTWNKVFETTIHLAGRHVTGLRGLTCIRNPLGSTDVLLVSVEDDPSRIYRINPRDIGPAGEYNATLELDVSSFLTQAIRTKTTYAIVAYNDMMEYRDSTGACSCLLLGLEAIAPEASASFGSLLFNTHGYYLVRDCGGNYALREIRDFQIEPEPWLVAVRTLALSPFPADPPGTVYAGGFDANYTPVHNTAWLYKGVPKEVPQ